jgi:hypothetical protein
MPLAWVLLYKPPTNYILIHWREAVSTMELKERVSTVHVEEDSFMMVSLIIHSSRVGPQLLGGRKEQV